MSWRSITDLKMAQYNDAVFHIELALERLKKQESKTPTREIIGFLRDAIKNLELP